MASLASLFVSIKGDPSDLNKTVAGVKSSLSSVDRMRVQPKITLPERVTADINGLSSKLSGLSKQRVSLNVDATTARADVQTLERQLDQMKRNRNKVPLELSGEADKAIAQVEKDLLAAKRRETTIPLKLERVDARIDAVKASLNTLERDSVDIPVDVDKGNTIRGKLSNLRARMVAGLKGGGDLDNAGRDAGKRYGNAFGVSLKGVLTGAVVVGATRALAGGLASTVNAAGGFEKSMNLVAVTTGEAGAGMKRLTDLALEMGAKTSFSAQGASDAMVALAKGGLTSAQIQAGALDSTLTLATAGGLELGRAADFMVQGLTAFGLEAKDSAQVAAALAGGANASTASVESMGLALSQVGAGAKVAGLSLQDTTAILAAFDNAGVKGSDAGTSLKVMLQRLVPSTEKAQNAMLRLGLITVDAQKAAQFLSSKGIKPLSGDQDELIGQLKKYAMELTNNKTFNTQAQEAFKGIAFETQSFNSVLFDAKGNIEDAATVSQRLQDALRGQTKEQKIATLTTLFGSDASRAAAILAENGAKGLAKYVTAVNDQTQAEMLAADATKGWAGAWEALTGGVETLQIQLGTVLLPVLTKMARFISSEILPAIGQFVSDMQSGEGAGGRFAAGATKAFLAAKGLYNLIVRGDYKGMLRDALGWTEDSSVVAYILKVRNGLVDLVGFFRENKVAIGAFAVSLGVAAVGLKVLAVQQGIMAAGGFLVFLTNALKATRLFTIAQAALTVVMSANPISLVVIALAALAAGVIYAYKHSETFRKIVNGLGAALKTGFLAAVGGIKSAVAAIPALWQSVLKWTKDAWASITGAVSSAWSAIGGFFSRAGRTILAPIVAAWNAVKAATSTVFKAVAEVIRLGINAWLSVIQTELRVVATIFLLAWQGLSSVAKYQFNLIKDKIVAPVWNAISGLFRQAQAQISRAWSVFWEANKAVARAAWTFVKDRIITPVWSAIRSLFTSAQTALNRAWTAFWDANRAIASAAWRFVKDRILTPIWGQIRSLFTTAQNGLRTAWNAFWNTVKSIGSTAWTSVRTTLSTGWGRIRDTFTGAQTAVRNSWNTFWGTIKRVGSEAMGIVRSNISSAFGKVKDTISGFVSAAGAIFDKIKGKFSGPVSWVIKNVFEKIRSAYNKVAKMVDLPSIPAFADGGSVGNPSGSKGSGGKAPSALADGGPVQRAEGGRIAGRGGPRQDNIAGVDRKTGVQTSWVSAGEFVVNAKQYKKNKAVVEGINAGLDVETAQMRGLDRAVTRAAGGIIPRLFLGGGTKPAAGSVSRHSGYGWAKWAGDINEPGAADIGHPVKAYKSGQVASTKVISGSYGRHMRVNHPGGERTLYAHLSAFVARAGQAVKEGQTIARKGNTGNSSGPHLHFELAGGSNKVDTGDTGGGIKGVIENVIAAIQPRAIFTKLAGKVLDGISKRIPEGDSPFGKVIAALPKKLIASIKDKLPESYGSAEADPGGGTIKSSPSGSGGLGPRARAARAYVVKRWGITNIGGYANRNIAGTNTKSKHASGKAIDIMTYNSGLHSQISNEFVSNRGKWGTDNVITKRRIWNKGRGWHNYGGIPHMNHVHVDFYKNGGLVKAAKAGLTPLATGGIVKGGRGGVAAHIGEGKRDELVTPLPRGWNMGKKSDDKLDRLIAAIEANGLQGATINLGGIHNPLPEAPSVTVNKSLQRIGSLGLV